ncbi:MAG: hypothetical protein WCZ90_09685 [Melioribacteraceae bacterium]
MNVKKYLLVFFISAFLLSITYAQPRPQQPPPKEDMLKQLIERLDLSAAQAKKVETILATTQKRMEEFKLGAEGDGPPPMEKMEEIMKKQDKEIEKILDDDQLKEYAKFKKERESRRPPMGGRPERQRN